MQLDLATAEYIGAREQQQDLAAALPLAGGALLVLADGLGGHESGAEASRIVVTTFKEAGAAGRFQNPGTCRQALREVLDLANARIAEGVDPSHGHRGMASTVVAAIVDNGELRWVSVGDSHLYLWREGRLHKLNEDHSQAGLMVRSGQYRPEDPEVLAVKSVLVSALTGRKLEIVDLPPSTFRLEPGDILMLASDGLNTLADDEIERIVDDVRESGAIKLSTTLLESVRSRRLERQDNTTVVVARVLEPARVAVPAAAARRPEVATAETFDDTSEERTQRIMDEPERAAAPEVTTKPVTRSASPKARETASSTAADPGPEASPSAPTPAASPVPEVKAREARSPLLKPKSERPAPPRLADAPDGPESEPVALGAAPADVAPDVPASRPRTVRLPRASVPRSSAVRGILVLVLLLLLASGVAIAAFKPGWLSGIVPGYGEANAPAPASKVEAVVEPKAKAAAPELAMPPAPAAKPTADTPLQATSAPEAPKAAPEASRAAAPSPEATSTSSATPSASVTAEPSGKAQAAGEAAAPAPPTQTAPLPAAGPPLVEPERPAARPGARGRAP